MESVHVDTPRSVRVVHGVVQHFMYIILLYCIIYSGADLEGVFLGLQPGVVNHCISVAKHISSTTFYIATLTISKRSELQYKM